MTTDTKAAQKFYGDVVGWGAQDSGTPGVNYTLFTVSGRAVAGLIPSELLRMWPISTRVNSPMNDDEELLTEIPLPAA